jgi:hypothetical protein
MAELSDPSLYHGLAGVVLALGEAYQHFGEDRYARAVDRGAEALADMVDGLEDCSLYFGLAGVAVALRDLGQDATAKRALCRIRERFDGQRWSEMFELLMGNAGIGLGALSVGDLDLAMIAVAPYLATADPTAFGVNWAVRPSPPRSHHIAHGTLGIAYALAAVGEAGGRGDMIELALAGAADVVGRNEAGPDGFLVPHSHPPHRRDLIERYSYGWCNGPAGDAQVFRLINQVTGDPAWTALGDRCWQTVTRSGLPRRLRPGLWDNNGRCCGTAGVLALACDRIVERDDDFGFADALVDDLAARPSSTAAVSGGPTTSTGPRPLICSPELGGRWETPVSSVSCSATFAFAKGTPPGTRSPGPTARPPCHGRCSLISRATCGSATGTAVSRRGSRGAGDEAAHLRPGCAGHGALQAAHGRRLHRTPCCGCTSAR